MINDQIGNSFANISFSLEVSFEADNSHCIAFIKKQPESVLTAEESAAKQLQLVDLGSGSPFETLHAYVHNTFAPFFRSFIKSQGSETKDSRLGKNFIVFVTSLLFIMNIFTNIYL